MSCLFFFFYLLLFLFFFPSSFSVSSSSSSSSSSSCNDKKDLQIIEKAFTSTKGLKLTDLYNSTICKNNSTTEIHLRSRNLTGTISWMTLHAVSTLQVVDLSNNFLHGSIPTAFWVSNSLVDLRLTSNRFGGTIRSGSSSSSLQKLDLADNRFTNSGSLLGFVGLRYLNLSGNNLRELPDGIGGMKMLEHLDLSRCNLTGNIRPISGLSSVKYLDVSLNRMNGSFPRDFPAIHRLNFLNISFNNFSGFVENEEYRRFGWSSFSSSGVHLSSTSNKSSNSSSKAAHIPANKHPDEHKQNQTEKKNKKENRLFNRATKLGISIGGGATLIGVATLLFICCCLRKNRKNKKWVLKQSSRFYIEMAPWVVEATGSSAAQMAPVTMFEKPLMSLTFSDLFAATSGFGEESQLAEGKSTGPIYRAVLSGDIDVAIKVLHKAKEVDCSDAKTRFHDLASIKHPNVLPLLGYCITGKEKLLLYEYIENGDLYRWLHELPLMEKHHQISAVEDWNVTNTDPEAIIVRTESRSWTNRYRIALGIARGLAFLHHGASKAPVVHGGIDLSNILLDQELEPKICWIGFGPGGLGNNTDLASSTESDVFAFGTVLIELLTGRNGSEETVRWVRELVRKGDVLSCLDSKIRIESDTEEREMTESVRVAYLCTSDTTQKRPSMRQVLGLMKDIQQTK